MRRLAGVLTLLLLTAGAAGCGAEGTSDASGSDGSSNSAPASGGPGHTVTGALTELPFVQARGRARVEVLTGSLEDATRLAGSERPTSTDPGKLVTWLRALNGDVALPVAASTGLDSINVDPEGRALGFTAADVRHFAELRTGGGRFSVQTLYDDASVRKDLPESAGLRTTSEGEPGEPTKDPAVSPRFPKVAALAEAGHRVAFSDDPEQVTQWRAGGGKRLDEDASLAAVAHALDRAGVYAAHLVDGAFDSGAGRRDGPGIREDFDTVGVGFTLDGRRPIVHVSYHFPGNAAAGARQARTVWQKGTSARVNAPLADYVEVRGLRTRGKVVTVELDTSATGPQVVLQMLTSADTPFQDR